MIVYDFNVVRILQVPGKTDAVLVVDPDTVLTGTTSLQRFKPVSRQRRKI
jgi:hypothetical protein